MTSRYIQAGLKCLDYYIADLDAANDAVQTYAPLTQRDLEKKGRNAPENFIHPLTATQVDTLATFVSQILAGASTTRKVEPRGDEDEDGAAKINELLQWNDDQQPTYTQMFLWLWDAFTFNRGVMYDYWQPLERIELEEVQYQLPAIQRKDEKGRFLPKEEGAEPQTVSRFRKKRVEEGGYTKISLISPYDFFCDPMLPLLRMQEGRYCGHRVMIPWHELKRRSQLPPEHYLYVIPSVVEKLKNRPASSSTTPVASGINQPTGGNRSRSYYERKRRGNPAGYEGSSDQVNKEDGGIIECFVQICRVRPKDYDIFDDEDFELVEILTAGEKEILSVNTLPNLHDQYPYAVGEARPNAHYQFSSSWALLIKPIQDYVDYLKSRHMESLARTTGNIFIGDPDAVDFEAFTNPDKDGLFIPIKPDAMGRPIDQIIKQVAVSDTTAKFHEEMLMWIGQAENTTGAHPNIQGQTEDPSQTATQFVGTQQMANGRISTMARNLSQMALVPQTRRIVMNLQQWMPEELQIRITGDILDYDPTQKREKFTTIAKSDIQVRFDVVPHDGSMPGTDARKVAALTRIIEASSNPVFAQYFDDTIPGNIHLRKVLYDSIRAAGGRLDNLIIDQETAMRNLKARNLAAGAGLSPGIPEQGAPAGPQPENIVAGPGLTMPDAGTLPPTPSAEPPLPNPATV